MIEPEDLIIPRNSSTHDRLAIPNAHALDGAPAETIAVRLSDLQSRPVPGAYDAIHLQQIHAYIFKDVFRWAGQFRTPESSSELDRLFDRLARENRLRGLDESTWSKRSIKYLHGISAIEPFIDGTDLALLEFFRQLAGENNMTLHCLNGINEPSRDELQSHLQRTQSNNFRRILMLAVDPYSTVRPSRELDGRYTRELSDP